jgi:two-component system cell cycle sensor histidine kinase/response regulator CckA
MNSYPANRARPASEGTNELAASSANESGERLSSASLYILYLHDDPANAIQLQPLLAVAGIRCTVAQFEYEADFVAALDRDDIHLIISDLVRPSFDSLSALKIAETRAPEVPFILLSGTWEEELAIKALESGATDFILRDQLARLAPAIRRALREVKARRDCKQIADKFIQSQKMDVVGQLAGGIAHDFNNILSIVLGYTEQIKQRFSAIDPTYIQVEEIRLAAERAASLTRQLLIFSRKQTMQLLVLDLNDVLRGTEKMLRRLIDEHIELTISYTEALGHIQGDAGYIGQILMNLVVNARDAMPRGGELVIETRNVSVGKSSTTGIPKGEYVLLQVSDTGVGMTHSVKSHLFEPYFTTKVHGKASGLGLATCQTIIKASNGYVQVESEPGKGAVFKVYFPRIDLPLPSKPSFREAPRPRGTETLLFVEDEPGVRHLAVDVLESQGYTVLRAPNGQDALHVVREHTGAPIALVVSDVVMPQMGGKVMAEWLKTTHPDLKVLFTSGYTDDAIASQGILDPGVAYLPKPYTTSALTCKVREVLDAP